jgi:hypothetical protein
MELMAEDDVIYDIDKLYEIFNLEYLVNDYIDGMTLGEIIEAENDFYKKFNVENAKYRYWILPVEKGVMGNCYIRFLSDEKSVEKIAKTFNPELNYDMKLYEGKYKEIKWDKIQDIIYLDLNLYGIKAVYIRMNDGMEYIAPYLTSKMEELCNLENEKIYQVDEFITRLYNLYKEPKNKDRMQGNTSGIISTRKQKLTCQNINEVRKMEQFNNNKIIIIVTGVLCVSTIAFLLYVRKKRNK